MILSDLISILPYLLWCNTGLDYYLHPSDNDAMYENPESKAKLLFCGFRGIFLLSFGLENEQMKYYVWQ